MNYMDLIVIAVIVGFSLLGMFNGLMMSLLGLVSYFLAYLGAIKFYPIVSNVLLKTSIYTNIKNVILNNMINKTQENIVFANNEAKETLVNTAFSSIKLPDFMKSELLNKLDFKNFIDLNGILDVISGNVAKLMIDILSIIILFVGIKLLLIVFRVVFKVIKKLPVIKQADMTGGFIFGLAQGVLIVFIAGALLIFFNTSPVFSNTVKAVNTSLFASYFYQNNFIVNWILR